MFPLHNRFERMDIGKDRQEAIPLFTCYREARLWQDEVGGGVAATDLAAAGAVTRYLSGRISKIIEHFRLRCAFMK